MNWSGYKADTEEAILPLKDMISIVSTPRHAARLSGNYISSSAAYRQVFLDNLKKVTRGASFWTP